MGLFDNFPYTNFHELNLMWILEVLKEIQTTMEQFVAINSLKYADPIQWNIVSQYEKNTIVIDPLTGTAYISVQPVPSGVIITNTDYWSVVFDLGSFVVRAAKNFCNRYEEATTLTATFPSSVNDWLIWGDTLYYALVNITAGDSYVVDSNIKQFTVEDVVGHIQDLNTIDKSNLVAAINELVTGIINIHAAVTYSDQGTNTNFDAAYGASALFWWNGKLYITLNPVSIGDAIDPDSGTPNCALHTIEQDLVSINTALNSISNTIGLLANLTTTDKTSIVNAINELVAVIAAFKAEVGELSDITIPSPDDFADAINKVWSRVLAVEHRVDMYHKYSSKKAILISDSYGVSPSAYDNWEVFFENATGITCTKLAYSGKGFYTNGVNSILQSFQAETIADKDSYTDIIVCLGANDIATVTAPQITSLIAAIVDFCNYCYANYPNADVHIGMCGYTIYGMPAAGTANTTNYLNVLAAYQLGAASGNAFYMSGVEYPMHYYPNISFVDGIHPTSAGATALGRAVVGAFKNGSYNYKGDGEFFRLTPVSGATINGATTEALIALCYIEDQLTWIAGYDMTMVFTPALSIGNSFVNIATINPKSVYANGVTIDIPITVMAICDIDPSNYINVPMVLRISSGTIQLKSLYINSGAFETHDFTTIIMSIPDKIISTLLN